MRGLHTDRSDKTLAHMAREMLAAAGIGPHSDDAGLRWVVVRHNDDHVHVVATTVREDGRIDWLHNDYPRVVDATFELPAVFGPRRQVPRPDRTATRGPGPPEANKARRLGRPRTGRDELRTRVRTAAASSTTEVDFFEQLRRAGVLINLRESIQRPGEVTGYSVALPSEEPGRTPIYFGACNLAPDLTLPKLRHRLGAPPPGGQHQRPRVSQAERVRVMHEASATAQAAATQMRADLHTDPAAAQATAEAAADTLRAVAAAMEGRRGGPITDAADAFDRAARAGTGPAGRHTPGSYRMRSTARLVSLMGRISGDEDALAALTLVLKIAALGDTLGRLRDAQDRLHQAQAARQAATALRAAATRLTRPVTPSATPNRAFDGGPARAGRRPSPTRTGGRRCSLSDDRHVGLRCVVDLGGPGSMTFDQERVCQSKLARGICSTWFVSVSLARLWVVGRQGVGRVADRFQLHSCFDDIGVSGGEMRVGRREDGDASLDGFQESAVAPGGEDLLTLGYLGENEASSGVATGEVVGSAVRWYDGVPIDHGGGVAQTDLVAALVRVVGGDAVIADAARLERYAGDASPISIKMSAVGRLRDYLPEVAVKTGSLESVAAVLEIARQRGIHVTARGLGSSVVGSAIPLSGGIVLDLTGMNRVLDLDLTSLTVRVEPGTNGGELERYLNASGLTTHFFPQSLMRSTVGGWVATRATGQFSSRWGGIEDLVVGLEVMLASGQTVRLDRGPRAAMGPDLIDLFIGSEGALGIVVSVTLRVFPIPAETRTDAIEFDDLVRGLETMRSLMQSGLHPHLLRLYDADEAAHGFGAAHNKPLMLLGFHGAGPVIDAEIAEAREVVRPNGGRSIGEGLVTGWLERRHDFSKVERILEDPCGVAETIEVAAGWGTIGKTYELLKTRLTSVVPHVLGHFSHTYSHGTSLYLILMGSAADAEGALATTRRLWDVAMTTCLESGAVLSHHHGVGIVRLPYLDEALGESLGLLRLVKAALDPDGILAPGKLGLAPRTDARLSDDVVTQS